MPETENKKIILRPYQQACLDSIIEHAKDKHVLRQVIVLATGTGKTIVFGHLPSRVKAKGKKTLILAHREELLTQAKDKLLKIDPDLRVGIEQGENSISNDTGLDVLIASVQTLGRKGSARIKKFNPDDYGLIVIDECHHSVSSTYQNILKHFDLKKGEIETPNARILLGVTATPNRSDHVGLDEVFDKIVYSYTLKQGIDDGYLANIRAFTVRTNTDISKVKTYMGDFSDKDLSKTINTLERNKLVIDYYKEQTPDTKALAFASSVQHTQDLSELFNKAGVKSSYILGTTKKEERDKILEDFEKGRIKVLVNCAVLTEGYDEPSIQTILMARPTKSSVAYSQMIGRGTRIDEGKDGVNVVDFVDNVGNNSIITLPSLFGIPKTLKGTKGKFITEILDKVNKIKEVNPNYDVSNIEEWKDEEIDKIVKRVDIFAQAELAPEVKQYSNLAWGKQEEEVYRLQIPAEEAVKEDLIIKKNMLDQWELVGCKYGITKPCFKNGFSKWQKLGEKILNVDNQIEQAFKNADRYVNENHSSYSAMFKQDSVWRQDAPSDAQIKLLNKFKVAIPLKLTKGQASVLIGKSLEIRNKMKKNYRKKPYYKKANNYNNLTKDTL